MSTIIKEFTKEQLQQIIETDHVQCGEASALARIALASLEAEPVPEWTNEQCMEFLSIAFRHAEINGDLQLDDIRLGVKMVNGIRAAMLQGADGNTPVIPDGYALVPMKLTAENGTKGALLGEFSETKFINCPECFGDDECDTCDGSGRIETKVQVSWTNIKAIWDKGIEHFSSAPKLEVKS